MSCLGDWGLGMLFDPLSLTHQVGQHVLNGRVEAVGRRALLLLLLELKLLVLLLLLVRCKCQVESIRKENVAAEVESVLGRRVEERGGSRRRSGRTHGSVDHGRRGGGAAVRRRSCRVDDQVGERVGQQRSGHGRRRR